MLLDMLEPLVTRPTGVLTVWNMTVVLAVLLLASEAMVLVDLVPPVVRMSVMLLLGSRFLLTVVPVPCMVLLTWRPCLPVLILAVVLIPTMVMLLVSPVRCLRSPLWLQLELAPLTLV